MHLFFLKFGPTHTGALGTLEKGMTLSLYMHHEKCWTQSFGSESLDLFGHNPASNSDSKKKKTPSFESAILNRWNGSLKSSKGVEFFFFYGHL